MSEKTEQATPYKLKKARERGQTARSQEFTSSISIIALLILGSTLGYDTLVQLNVFFGQMLHLSGIMHLNIHSALFVHDFSLKLLLTLWMPFALTLVGVILISNWLQGWVWSFSLLKFDFTRLSIYQGFKKIASPKPAIDGIKILCKLVGFALIVYLNALSLNQILFSLLTSSNQITHLLLRFFIKAMFQIALMLFCFAILDKWFSQRCFLQKLRMSKQEIKEEYRQREGDPKIKSKMKQLQHQLRQKTASLQEVKNADLIITNPTHIAIALKYERHTMPAPKIICKAEETGVLHVRDLARKYGIPVYEQPQLARLLYHTVRLNHYVPAEFYAMTAALFRTFYASSGVDNA